MTSINIEQMLFYSNAVSIFVVLVCLLVVILVTRPMGKDERAYAISYRVSSCMFYALAAQILLASGAGWGRQLSGLEYQRLVMTMFALSVVIGTVYLFMIKRRY